jgi:MFS family permease
VLIGCALLIGTPFFVVFGRLSDRIGRKRIILVGCVAAMLTLFPIFRGLTHFANPALAEFEQHAAITVAAQDCHFNIFAKPSTPCDRARDFLTKAGVSYASLPFNGTDDVVTTVAGESLVGFDEGAYRAALQRSGYPAVADPARVNAPMTVLLLVVLMLYVTMVYGPIAAFLVELFPTRIRYTSMSLPYHIGNGWFGGFLPFIAAALVVKSGNIYYGLWYPIVVAAITAAVGGVFIKDRRDVDLRAT